MCYCTPSIRTPYCKNCTSYMRTEIESLREQLNSRIENEPVAWMHETEGLSYENCYAGSVPLYPHPISDAPVAYANADMLDNMLDDRGAVVSGVKDGFYKTPLYLHPSRHLSDEEILALFSEHGHSPAHDYMTRVNAVEFARALLLEANR